ncbi:MAG: cell division protein FtsQ/DivIB, partial [Sulfurifustis sp.]
MPDRSALWGVLRLTMALIMFVAVSYAADWMLRAENFPVQHLRFEGPFQRVHQVELEGAVLDLVRGNFFLVDLDAVQSRVEALPWVHRATVRRSFPRDISIQFTEQRLVARWANGAWVNTDGEVVRVAGDDLSADLPRLVGPEGTSAQVLAAYRDFTGTLAPLH